MQKNVKKLCIECNKGRGCSYIFLDLGFKPPAVARDLVQLHKHELLDLIPRIKNK